MQTQAIGRREAARDQRPPLENALWYAAQKSRQDMAAALEACTDDFVLESPSFNVRLVGREQNLKKMDEFFAAFPDYDVVSEHTALGEGCVVLTGRVRMTPSGPLLGLVTNGKRAEVPFSAMFETRGNLLSREVFLIDAVELCAQTGLPLAIGARLLGKRLTSAPGAVKQLLANLLRRGRN